MFCLRCKFRGSGQEDAGLCLFTVCAAIVFFVSFPVIPVVAKDVSYRVWTSAKGGNAITAILADEKDEVVRLKMPDGRMMQIKRADLSAGDQSYLDEIRAEKEREREAAEKAAANPPAPEMTAPEVPLAPDFAGLVWLLTNCTLYGTSEGKDISASYTERVDNMMVTKTPPVGYRLVLLKCRLAALSADPNAIDKLAAIRKTQADRVPFIGNTLLIGDSERKQLTGQYMMFDLNAFCLTNNAMYIFKPQWLVRQDEYRGPYLLNDKSGKPVFSAATMPMRPWNRTCQEIKGFTGLLESGRLVDLEIVFAVIKNMDLSGMRAKIEGQFSVPVELDASLGKSGQ